MQRIDLHLSGKLTVKQINANQKEGRYFDGGGLRQRKLWARFWHYRNGCKIQREPAKIVVNDVIKQGANVSLSQCEMRCVIMRYCS